MLYVSRYLKKKYASGHYGKRNAISLVLQKGGKSKMWPTELRSGGRGNLTGWSSFTGANGLRKNDLCPDGEQGATEDDGLHHSS